MFVYIGLCLGPEKYFLNMGVNCMCTHWGTPTHQCLHSGITCMCLVCSQIGCRDTEHTMTWSMREHQIERNVKSGPVGFLDASPYRSMV
jgi:hypothetical protein